MTRRYLLSLFCLTLLFPRSVFSEDFADQLPRIPPTSPQAALKTFQLAKGYKIELVASEPLVNSPVAIEWAANGKMYVCEMRGYSENRDDRISRIALLTDKDQDGVYDERSEFVSGLHWPTAIFPYEDGLFVGDAPDVFYFKDTNGDGVADQKKKVLTGFGVSNVQGLMNSMRWGLDNRIHLACSSVGGSIKIAGSQQNPVNIRGRDIAFDPVTYEFTPTSGAAQHGMCFDDWGRKFTCSNSNHIQQVMYADHHVARNPLMRTPPSRISIAADGAQAEVFRTSPVEPWRIVRTRLRVSGKVRGPIEGGGRPAGYFTGATGLTIYRGDAWLARDKGLAIIGDVGSNLVHRKRLTTNGLEFVARRIDDNSEFVTSTDIWFRPAQFANAPDGSLHVIDVCREVIEHPKSLPPEIKKHLDLTAGRDRGRIYRIVPTDFKFRATPNLSNASTEKLVNLLSHDNAWHRETASRLIYQRQDKSAVLLLQKLIDQTEKPLSRLHALYALDGLDGYRDDAGRKSLRKCMSDRHPQIRRHAILIADRNGIADRFSETLLSMRKDTIEIRYALAFAAGGLKEQDRHELLIGLARSDIKDRWMQAAIQSSLGKGAGEVFARLVTNSEWYSDSNHQAASQFLADLAIQIRKSQNRSEIGKAIAALSTLKSADYAFVLPVVGELVGSIRKLEGANPNEELRRLKELVSGLMQKTVRDAIGTQVNVAQRIVATEMLMYGEFDEVGEVLTKLIDNHQPVEVQSAALEALDRFTQPQVATIVIDAWKHLTPQLRQQAIEVLLARPERTIALFDAIGQNKFPSESIPVPRLQQLARSRNRDIAVRAKNHITSFVLRPRGELIDSYRASLKLKGNPERGSELAKQHCVSCHKIENEGKELGPNLAAMKARGAEAILTNLLDPNREVNPQYLSYNAELHDGRVISGIITAENSNSVTIINAQKRVTIPRDEIAELISTRKSLMPEGLEKQLDKQAVADLIAYLLQLN